MTSDHSPILDLLKGLSVTEEELLALVEGELDAARAQEVAAVLRSRPRLAAIVEGMAGDRELLAKLSDMRAPEGLVESAMERLEREALLGAPTPLPFAAVESKPRNRFAQALALAAGFALVIGAAAYFAMMNRHTPVNPGIPGPIAKETTDTAPIEVLSAPAPVDVDSAAARSGALADASADLTEHDALAFESFVGPPTPPGAFESLILPSTEIDIGRAAVLAREGRLALRVKTAGGQPMSVTRDAVAIVPVTEAGLAALRRKMQDAGQQVEFEELPYEFPLPFAPDQEFMSLPDDQSGERAVAPVVVE